MLETNPDWAPSLNLNNNKIMKARQKMSKSHPTEEPQMQTGGGETFSFGAITPTHDITIKTVKLNYFKFFNFN